MQKEISSGALPSVQLAASGHLHFTRLQIYLDAYFRSIVITVRYYCQTAGTEKGNEAEPFAIHSAIFQEALLIAVGHQCSEWRERERADLSFN